MLTFANINYLYSSYLQIMQTSGEFYILHFNDVYDIEEQTKEPRAGVARFLTLLSALQTHFQKQQITLFSGDVFAPSQLSAIYKGQQMVYPMQQFKIDVSCLGNHDLDCHLDHITDLIQQTQSPWIISNLFDALTKKPIAGVKEFDILDVPISQHCKIRIGIIGLAEEEWIGQITEIPQSQMIFEDFLPCASRLAQRLRGEFNCQVLIALTHMRVPNDHKLVHNLPTGLIDIVLGGHDHIWHYEKLSESFYLKSGTNFKNLSLIRISIGDPLKRDWISEIQKLVEGISNEDLSKETEYSVIEKSHEYLLQNPISKLQLSVELLPLNLLGCIKKNLTMDQYVQEKIEKYNEETLKTLCYIEVPLDTRFKYIRCNETPIANFYSDLIRAEFQTEVGLINAGSIRSDEYFQIGYLTYQNINKIFAQEDFLLSFKMNGKNLHYTLENGLSLEQADILTMMGDFSVCLEFNLHLIRNCLSTQEQIKSTFLLTQRNWIMIESIQLGRIISQLQALKIILPFLKMILSKIDHTLAIQWLHLITSFFELAQDTGEIRDIIEQNEGIQELDLSGLQIEEQKFNKFRHLIQRILIIDKIPYISIAPKLEQRINFNQ